MAGMIVQGLGIVKGITPKTIIHIDGNSAHVRKVSKERFSSFVKEVLNGEHKEMNRRLSERLPRLNPHLIPSFAQWLNGMRVDRLISEFEKEIKRKNDVSDRERLAMIRLEISDRMRR